MKRFFHSPASLHCDVTRLVSIMVCVVLVLMLTGPAFSADVVLADFEGPNYGDWTIEGNCFGKEPAHGELTDHQQPVSGYLGEGLVNTFLNGDGTTGTMTSPELRIEHRYLNLLVGGGAHRYGTYVELLVEGEPVARVSGVDNERLIWRHFDLGPYAGKTARVRIVDRETGPWGHINADQITLSDTPKGDVIGEIEPPLKSHPELAAQLKEVGVEEIIFAIRKVDGDGHWYANFGYWSSNPDRKLYHDGAKLCRLRLADGEVTTILDAPAGGIRDPHMHYDGQKILFSYRKDGQPFYHLYEINIDGTGLRQITDGPHDDIEAIYLPGGDIVFCSSRCNRMVNCWHVRVAIIYRCGPDGQDVRPLSCNIEQDNTPWLLPDGKLIYQRWEYIDRSQVRFHHLWTMNPDGTNQMVYFGNMHPGTLMIDAKPIPGTGKVVAAFCPGHGRKEHEGWITIVDPTRGPDQQSNATKVGNAMYRDPYPLSEDMFLVCRFNDIGVLSGEGDYQPLWELPEGWRASDTWVHEPRPLRSRKRERLVPDRVQPREATGVVVLDNVYIGRNMGGVEKGDIKKLLILEALPKPVNFSGGYEPISFGGTFTLERVLGTVPVEEDGSAHFELPALRSVFFVALDENDDSVKRMQSFMTVQPGERLSCIGCHENRGEAPTVARLTQAMRRAPSKIEPLEGIPGVFDYPRDIQPILDRHCVACHDYEKTDKGGPMAGGVILTGDYSAMYTHSYYMLSILGQIADGENANGNRPPRTIGAVASPLMDKLQPEHYGVKVSEHEKTMIRYWIESAAPYPGTYAALLSGMVGGRDCGDVIRRRCQSCHDTNDNRLPARPGEILLGGFHGGGQVRHANSPRKFRHGSQIIYNLSRPEYSMVLLAPLAKSAGGYGMCDKDNPTFRDKSDPDYQKLLEAIQGSREDLMAIKRFDMPGFRPNEHYIREMQVYGVLPKDLADDAPIDPYKTDELYWRSHWYVPK